MPSLPTGLLYGPFSELPSLPATGKVQRQGNKAQQYPKTKVGEPPAPQEESKAVSGYRIRVGGGRKASKSYITG